MPKTYLREIIQKDLDMRCGQDCSTPITSRDYLMSGFNGGENPFFEHRTLSRMIGDKESCNNLEFIVTQILTPDERAEVFKPHELGSFIPLKEGAWKPAALAQLLSEFLREENLGGFDKRLKQNQSWIKQVTGFSYKDHLAVQPSIAGKVLALICSQQGEDGYQQIRSLFKSPLIEHDASENKAGMAFRDSYPCDDPHAKRNAALISDFKARLLFEVPAELRMKVKKIYPDFCAKLHEIDLLLNKTRIASRQDGGKCYSGIVPKIITSQLATPPVRKAARLDLDLWLAIELMEWENHTATMERMMDFLQRHPPTVPRTDRPYRRLLLLDPECQYEEGHVFRAVQLAMEDHEVSEHVFMEAWQLAKTAVPWTAVPWDMEYIDLPRAVAGTLAVLDGSLQPHTFRAYWRGQHHQTGHLYAALMRVAKKGGDWQAEPEEFREYWYWRTYQVLDQLNGQSDMTCFRLKWPLLLSRLTLSSLRRAGPDATIIALNACATELSRLVDG